LEAGVADRVSELLLRYAVDQGSVSRTISANDSIVQALDRTQRQALTIEDAAERVNAELAEFTRSNALEGIARDASAAAAETGDFNDALFQATQRLADIGASDSEIRRVTRQLLEAEQASEEMRQSLDKTQSSAEQLGRTDASPDLKKGDRADAIENLGERTAAIFGGFEGGSELANAAGLLGDLGAAASTLNPLLIAGTVATGALAAIIGELGRQAEETRAKVEEYTNAQREFADLFATGGTTEDAEAQREREQRELDFLSFQRAGLEAARANFEAIQAELDRGVTDPARIEQLLDSRRSVEEELFELTGQRITSEEELTEALRQNETARNEARANIADINALISSGILSENDQAAFKAKVQEALPGVFQGIAGDIGEGLERAFDFLNGPEGLADVLGDGSVKASGAVQEFDALSLALGDMSGAAANAKQAAAEAAEAERELLEERKELAAGEYLETLEAEGKARQKATEAAQKLAEAEQQHATNLVRIESDLRTAIGKAEQEADQAEIEARQKAADRLVKIDEKLGEDLAKIRERFNDSIADAEGRRDVDAAIRLRKQRDQELRDREKAAEDQRKEVDEGLREQLRIINQRYAEQEQRAREAAARARDQEIQRAQQEIATRRAANDQAQVDLVNALNAQRTLWNAYLDLLEQDLETRIQTYQPTSPMPTGPSTYGAPGFGPGPTAYGASSINTDLSRSNVYNIYVSKDGVTEQQARALSGSEALRIVREVNRRD
jgi:vacuolar-type H+-ATPase subunit I/STV1